MNFITLSFAVLTILIIAFGIPFFIKSWKAVDDPEIKFIILLIALFSCLINFGLIGGVGQHFEDSRMTNDFEYSKLNNGVTVSFENPCTNESELIKFTDARTYNIISDSSSIEVTCNVNIYGVIINTETKVLK